MTATGGGDGLAQTLRGTGHRHSSPLPGLLLPRRNPGLAPGAILCRRFAARIKNQPRQSTATPTHYNNKATSVR